MSRCFPFPPPGYVKKGTTNDADLLKKEKHREKKHKKEKKESKDKRKKEKSEGNDREKKDKRGDKEKDKDGDKVKYKNSITVEDEKKLAWKPVVHTGEILNGFSNDGKTPGKVFEDTRNQDNHHLVKDTEASKYVQDLGRKVGYEEKGPVQNFTGADQKKEDKTVFELVTKDLSNGPEAKVKNMGRPGSKVMSESNGNAMLPIFPGIFDGKTDLISKSIGSKAEGKTKTTNKEREDKHREKKSKGKDKNSEKKEVKYDEMTREQDNPKVEKNGYMGIYMPASVKDMAQGHVRKRKDFGDFLGSGQVPDGAAHHHLHPDANIKHPPCPPCILSSHSSTVQNGKVMQAPLSSGTISTNLVVDEKKLKVTSSPVPKKITPHPDIKYLDEVLSVPKMEEWAEYDDDQEWLRGTWLKKPRIENISMDGSPPRGVWDKAVLIESAEVYALPYVIPF